MADVWSAVHPSTGAGLALKVLKFDQQQPAFAHALAREVRAMARLPHDNIVAVVGHGTVAPQDAAAAPNRLVAHAPWFAMERLDGSLRDHMPEDWPTIREACRQVLLGLGHAHARTVIHRDLKPSNVLVKRSDSETRFAIADFGIAHVRDERNFESAQLRRVAGTPQYMAPEQYVGRWRDFGPWTDLYALGCMMFEFVYGRPPFVARTLIELAQAHITGAIPSLRPRVAVPEGIDPWIRCLMSKAPEHRPPCAADALAALPAGGDAFRFVEVQTEEWGEAETLQLLEPTLFATTIGSAPPLSDAAPPDVAHCVIPPAPIPPTPPTERAQPPTIGELATSLFELRPLPDVAPEGVRERLWHSLRQAAKTGARVHIFEGPNGSVGDLMVEQFAQSAAEAGAATWLRCEGREASDRVLIEGLNHLLGTRGAPSDQLEALLTTNPLAAGWPASLRAQLAEVLSAAARGMQPRMGTHAARTRLAIIRTALKALASTRPLVVTMTDGHVDDLEVIEGLLDEPSPEPVLFVGWVSESMVTRMQGWALETFQKLREHPRTERTVLTALSAERSVKLVAQNIQLSPKASQIAEEADLGPYSTIQLFGHWTRTGMLRWSARGFELDSRARLPSSEQELWRWRLGEVSEHTEALEIAAALGEIVLLDEWTTVCEAAGIRDGRRSLDILAERGMGTLTAELFTFAATELRQALLTDAPSDRLRRAHSLIADTLELPLRRELKHLLESKRYDELVDRLGNIWVPSFLAETADPAVVDMGLEAVRRLQLDDDDIRVARVERHRSRRLRIEGNLDDAMRINDRIAQVARRNDDWRLEADSLVRTGSYLQLQGKFDDARGHMLAALRCLRPHESEERRMVGMATLALGMLEGDRGQLNEAVPHLREACRLLDTGAEGDAAASAYVGLGSLLVRAGQLDEARMGLARATELCETAGSRLMLGRTLNMLGDLERKSGDIETARTHYRRAQRALALTGGDDVAYPLFNLAMVALQQDEISEATPLFAEVEQIATRFAAARLRAAADAGLRVGQAHAGARRTAGDWEDLQQAIERGHSSDEMAQLLAIAGRLLEQSGASETARFVRTMAVDCWRRSGEDAKADALERLLGIG